MNEVRLQIGQITLRLLPEAAFSSLILVSWQYRQVVD